MNGRQISLRISVCRCLVFVLGGTAYVTGSSNKDCLGNRAQIHGQENVCSTCSWMILEISSPSIEFSSSLWKSVVSDAKIPSFSTELSSTAVIRWHSTNANASIAMVLWSYAQACLRLVRLGQSCLGSLLDFFNWPDKWWMLMAWIWVEWKNNLVCLSSWLRKQSGSYSRPRRRWGYANRSKFIHFCTNLVWSGVNWHFLCTMLQGQGVRQVLYNFSIPASMKPQLQVSYMKV